jgi:hypothetical protein
MAGINDYTPTENNNRSWYDHSNVVDSLFQLLQSGGNTSYDQLVLINSYLNSIFFLGVRSSRNGGPIVPGIVVQKMYDGKQFIQITSNVSGVAVETTLDTFVFVGTPIRNINTGVVYLTGIIPVGEVGVFEFVYLSPFTRVSGADFSGYYLDNVK